ncbi:MAG: glycosyl hydrolase 115 family protein, partial [Firmicutes bacterium]|nr:glycosyl hydrolase 115 family protein [Bacillota bacterium]
MFVLHRRTKIVSEVHTKPVENAIAILQRDMNVYLRRKDVYGPMYEMNKKMQEREDQQEFKGKNNEIQLVYNQELAEEAYRLTVETERILIEAADDLGFVYGLLFISSEFLKVSPFWYWMENTQKLGKYVELEEKVYESPKPVVRFRGWFFNDEVLFMKWHIDDDHDTTWKMAFETLLRCGGNMAIPGTDKEARCNWKLAAEMGLWITHHHAEPLGAEMFIRAYPNEEPNYLENTALFEKLWEDAVIEQKDYKVIWNLCFRGQGDAPFWASDTSGQFNTPEKRGALISQVVRKQSEFVKKYVKDPIFCTNLYGEIMELYKEGCLDLDPNVIKVRADNGYAKMVTRRRDNHTVRVSSMPDPEDKSPQGIYYHVSFYDLQ